MVPLEGPATRGILCLDVPTKESSMNKFRITLAAALAAVALPAMAQSHGPMSQWYVGVGVGGGNLNQSGTDLTGLTNATLDDTATTYTIRTGWRFNPYMALELGYYDLGKYSFHGPITGTGLNVDGEVRAKSVGLSFVGIMPIQYLDLYGRIGYARSELKANGNTQLSVQSSNIKDHQNEFTYGVGGRWNFGPQWGLFAEWMKNDKISVDSYLVGIDFRF
jgi:OOP family OmpA-OmpF porin